MLEEKIFQVLKSKITDGGRKATSISDRTIMAEARRCGKNITEESQIETGIADAIESLAEYEGNLSAVAADVARRSTTPPANPPAPVVTPPAPAVDEETKALLKTILEKQKAQEEKETNSQKLAAQKAKLTEAASLAKGLGAIKEEVLNITLALHQFDDALTAEQIAKEAIPLYNAQDKKLFGDGGIPKSAAPLSDEAKKERQKKSLNVVDQALIQAGITPATDKKD
jgi:hypothetical protein